MTDTIDEHKLFSFYEETINSCCSSVLELSDELIEYKVFEVFDIGVHSFLHENNLLRLFDKKLITSNVFELSLMIRKLYLEIENTDDWSIRGVKTSSKWLEIMKLCDKVKSSLKS